MVEYRTVRIPEELVKTVKKTMKKRDNLAYRSHSEFIIDAVRRRVEDLMNSEYDLEKDH
jgi:metal-responsive CopG/Arc/MetJ family transcriptional regulator